MEDKGPEDPSPEKEATRWPALPGPRPAERWVWAEVLWTAVDGGGAAGRDQSPQARIVRLSHFLWLYCLCPTPYCLVSFCPPFSAAAFYFPACLVVFISFV